MTKEEREKAIDLLDNLIGMVEDNHKTDYDTALRMGIEALEQEPCEDAVSRQAVLNLFNKSDMRSWAMSLLKRKIEEMPPVNQVACIAEIKFSKEDMQKLVNEKIKEITAELEERKWIPVGERLPKECGFYLVSTTDCITIMEFCKGWISQNIGSCNWYVKAWMQLPDAYKKEVK